MPLIEESLDEAIALAAQEACYRMEIHFHQASETHDPRVQVYRYFGFLTFFERGSTIDDEKHVLEGADNSMAVCVRKLDTSKKGRSETCNTILDHALLSGRWGYCPRCKTKSTYKHGIEEIIAFSESSLHTVAATIVMWMNKLDPRLGVDLYLNRYRGNLWLPTMARKAGEMEPDEAWKKIVKARPDYEVSILKASEFHRLAETGGSPVALVEGFLRA